MKTAWVPFATWHSWSPEERGQFATYCENKGLRLAIDLKDEHKSLKYTSLVTNVLDGNTYGSSEDLQRDADEYRDEMSLGGLNYDPYKVG